MSELLEEIQEEFLTADARCSEVLERWGKTSALPPEVVEEARRKYRRLHVAVLQTLSEAAALEQRVAQLSSNLQNIRVQQELVDSAEAGSYDDAVQILDKFREDRDAALEQATECEHRAEAAVLQLQAMANHRDVLNNRLAELEDERRAELAPQIKAAQDEADLVEEQLRGERLKAQAAQRELSNVVARLEALQLEMRSLGSVVEQEQRALAQCEKLPDRCRRDADAVVGALRALGEREAELEARARELDAEDATNAREARDVEAQQEVAVRAANKLRAAMSKKEGSLAEALKDIEMAKLETERYLADRVTLDLEFETRGGEAKRETEGLKFEQRARDAVLKRLGKAERDGKAAEEELPPLQNAASNMGSLITVLRKQLVVESDGRGKLQKELEGLVGQVAAEKNLTDLQNALVKASVQDVHLLDKECADFKAAVAKWEKLAQDITSQRDAAGRHASQWVIKLTEALDAAEAKDAEVDELHLQHKTVKAQHRELRGLCELMSEQLERLSSIREAAKVRVQSLGGEVEAAQQLLRDLEGATQAKSEDVKNEEKGCAAGESAKALLASRLAAAREQHEAAAEQADLAGIEVRRLQRAVEEGQEATRRLEQGTAAARAAKQEAQQVLLGRDDEMCNLYEQSDVLLGHMDEGTRALSRCDDDIRMLQLEVAELQRKLFATQKTAPDVATYDRSIAQLKAEVFRARREAEGLTGTLEDPDKCQDRWRLLPGTIPSREDLTDRMGQIDGKLNLRLNQIAQKDMALDELQRLIDSLVQKAAVSHDGSFQISVQMNDCQRGLQALTRRMMAAVSELALYQALSLKYKDDRELLAAEVEAARHNTAEGRPPTAGADKEFARMERDRAQQAEIRAQAAELRRLREVGLLDNPSTHSTAAPRPHAYLPDDLDALPKPFLAPFAPFKPSSPPLLPRGSKSLVGLGGSGGRSRATSPTLPSELTVSKV